MVPGAFVGGFLLLFPLHWILMSSCRSETVHLDQGTIDSIERFLTPFVFSLGFVWLGSRVAPNSRAVIGFYLSILVFLLSIGGRVWAHFRLPEWQPWLLWPLVSNLAGIVAGFFAAVSAAEDDPKEAPETAT